MSEYDLKWRDAAIKICNQLGDSFIMWIIVEPYSDDHPGAPAPYPAQRDGLLFARAWLVAEIASCLVHDELATHCLEKIRKQYTDAKFYEEDWKTVVEAAKNIFK